MLVNENWKIYSEDAAVDKAPEQQIFLDHSKSRLQLDLSLVRLCRTCQCRAENEVRTGIILLSNTTCNWVARISFWKSTSLATAREKWAVGLILGKHRMCSNYKQRRAEMKLIIPIEWIHLPQLIVWLWPTQCGLSQEPSRDESVYSQMTKRQLDSTWYWLESEIGLLTFYRQNEGSR